MWQKTKNLYHLQRAILANLVHGAPAREMQVIGVTGTDGKTTTSSMIYHIFKEAGAKVALLTTVSAIIDGQEFDTGFHVTTPDSFAIQKYLKKAKDAGVRYFILEVTSHGLDQNRVYGIPFHVGVVTNITKEHLDYHKTYENYAKAKMKLLRRAKLAVINHDDESYLLIMKMLRLTHPGLLTYGMGSTADVNPSLFPFKTNLLGKFNDYNALAAITVCKAFGVADEIIRSALLSFTPPIGRQEVVYDKVFKVIIDFAHTPNAFEKILPEAKKLGSGRLIHVFGAAGQRDASKRPQMGKISAMYADIIILTAEDPRTESIEKINDNIESGIERENITFVNTLQFSRGEFGIVQGKKYVFRIPNRQEAIEFAVSLAQKGDVVILTGKSHEKSMNYGTGEELWNEYKTARDALAQKEKE